LDESNPYNIVGEGNPIPALIKVEKLFRVPQWRAKALRYKKQ
jgi:hypothetical protein